MNAHRQTCSEWDSHPRLQYSSGRRQFVPQIATGLYSAIWCFSKTLLQDCTVRYGASVQHCYRTVQCDMVLQYNIATGLYSAIRCFSTTLLQDIYSAIWCFSTTLLQDCTVRYGASVQHCYRTWTLILYDAVNRNRHH
jgi:hypothetical protein